MQKKAVIFGYLEREVTVVITTGDRVRCVARRLVYAFNSNIGLAAITDIVCFSAYSELNSVTTEKICNLFFGTGRYGEYRDEGDCYQKFFHTVRPVERTLCACG